MTPIAHESTGLPWPCFLKICERSEGRRRVRGDGEEEAKGGRDEDIPREPCTLHHSHTNSHVSISFFFQLLSFSSTSRERQDKTYQAFHKSSSAPKKYSHQSFWRGRNRR